MLNPYLPKIAKIKKIQAESTDTKLFTFEFVEKTDRDEFSFRHGQFLMAGILGFGEGAFDICSSAIKTETVDLAIRKIGQLTEKFHQARVGDVVTLRGPFGNGLKEEIYKNRNILLIGGGCGFVTMRSFILDYLHGALNTTGKVQVLYGCLNEANMLYKDEYGAWRQKIDLHVILNKPSANWRGPSGVITKLFSQVKILNNSIAVLCGPPIMYKFVIQELQKLKFADADIYLSLERRMYCGVGVCQHCAIGPYYVCKDGPIFTYAQLKNIPNAI